MKPEEIADGIYYDMPEAQYRALPFAHYSAVKLLCMGHTPEHYISSGDGMDEDTDSKRFGRVVDSAILTPNVLESVKKLPDNIKSRRGAEWERLRASEPDKTFLPPSEWATFCRERDAAYRVREKLMNHPTAGELLREIKTQVVIIWTDEDTGLRCKGLLDILGNGFDYIADLKTTGHFLPYRILRSGYNLGYHIQSAMYTDGLCKLTGKDFNNPMPFWFIFIESKYPHLPLVGNGHSAYDERTDSVDPYGYLKEGREQYKAALRTIAQCELTGEWEGHPFEPMDMAIPKFAGMEAVYV